LYLFPEYAIVLKGNHNTKESTSQMNEQTELLRKVRTALQNRDYKSAITYLKQTAKMAGDSGDTAAEGRHLGNLALIYYRLNQPERALRYFGLALERAKQEKDRVTEGGLLGNMGNILREMGRLDDAIDYLNRALIIAQEIGDIRGRGIWLGNLGLVYDDSKQSDKAVEYHQKAIEIARELHDQRGLVSRLSNLGNSHVTLEQYAEAITQFKEVVTLQEALGEKTEVALRLGIIGNLYNELGRQHEDDKKAQALFVEALEHYDRTLAMARELDDVISEAQLLRSIGGVLASVGRFDDSLDYLDSSRDMFDVLGLDDEREMTDQHIKAVNDYRSEINNPSS